MGFNSGFKGLNDFDENVRVCIAVSIVHKSIITIEVNI